MQPALLGVLSDPVSGVRVEAVKALGVLGMAQPEVLDALLNALRDADAATRRAAAMVLGELGVAKPKVLDALLGALSDPVKEVRQVATHALTRLPVERLAIGQRILEQLISYDVVTSNQFTADPVVDELFAALQQIVGAV